MTPEEYTRILKDSLALATAIAAEHPELALAPVVDGLSLLVEVLPPIAAKDLSPEDRAAADKEAADREAAKFGKGP